MLALKQGVSSRTLQQSHLTETSQCCRSACGASDVIAAASQSQHDVSPALLETCRTHCAPLLNTFQSFSLGIRVANLFTHSAELIFLMRRKTECYCNQLFPKFMTPALNVLVCKNNVKSIIIKN